MTATATSKERLFFTGMSVIILLTVLTGFANTYGRRLIGEAPPAPTIIHVHAVIFSFWLFLFVFQCALVFTKNLSLHKKIGRIAVLVVPLMLITGFLTAVDAAKAGHIGIPGVEFKNVGGFLLLNLNSVFIFFILAFYGYRLKHDAAAHKRLMYMATVAALAPPGISRLPLISGHTPLIAGVTMLFVLSGLIFDRVVFKKVHRCYWLSLPAVLFILPPVVDLLSNLEIWKQITTALTS